ncbi:hypothetical protein Tco_0418384 [Tanacetum coccineum]
MKSIQNFLKKFNRISFRETPKVLSLARENFFKIQYAFKEKQHQREDIQELLCKLLKDLQIISEELADYINTPNWNRPTFYDDDNDNDEYTIQYREYLENSSNARRILHAFKEKQHQREDIQELVCKLLKDLQIISEELADYINTLNWNRPTFYDDDDDDDEYTIQYREYLENSSNAITPDLPNEEPDNSLSMGDEHLSTILEKESDEVIKSTVEDLIPIPSESEGISDDTCDVPICDNSPPLDVFNEHFEIFSDFNDDCTLSNDDSFEDIDYVEASPPEDSFIMGNEELTTILEKESDEFIKSSVDDHVPIPSESEDTSRSDSECILP